MERKFSILGFTVMFLIGSDTFVVAPLMPSLAKAFDVSMTQSGWSASKRSGTRSPDWCPGRSRTEVTAGSSLRLGWWFSRWQQQPAQFPRGSGRCSPSVLSLAVQQHRKSIIHGAISRFHLPLVTHEPPGVHTADMAESTADATNDNP